MKKLVIDVKCWGRGDYHNNGKFCAVGFLVRQRILDKKEKITEDSIDNEVCVISSKLKNEMAITTANDELNGKKRRETLKKLFKQEGYQLVFKNL